MKLSSETTKTIQVLGREFCLQMFSLNYYDGEGSASIVRNGDREEIKRVDAAINAGRELHEYYSKLTGDNQLGDHQMTSTEYNIAYNLHHAS